MSKRNEKLYIHDILEAIKNIENYTKKISFNKFAHSQIIIDAVVRNFEIIGEAAKNLSPKTKSSHSDIPWKNVLAMRNKIIHEYFGVDLEIIWQTIQQDLPHLKNTVKKMSKK